MLNDTTKIAFGRVFRRLREERGFSQFDMEVDYGIARHYQSDIENGKRNVSLLFMDKTAKAFGIRLYELIEMVEKEKMTKPI